MEDNNIHVQIVIDPPDTNQVSRSMKSIEEKVTASGRKIGESMSSVMGLERQLDRQLKVDNWLKYGAAIDVATARFKQHIAALTQRPNVAFDPKNSPLAGIVEAEKRQLDVADARFKQHIASLTERPNVAFDPKNSPLAGIVAAGQSDSPAGVYAAAGITSPQERVAGINSLTAAQRLLNSEFKAGAITSRDYSLGMSEIQKKLNLLEFGNVRARGGFHKLIAAMASFTFEITGAIYGLLSLGAILGGPAILGIKFQKTLEDTQMGMTGILLTMGRINGQALKLPEALNIAKGITNKLASDSLKYAINLEDLTRVFQAILAPGLAAGMKLEEIRKVATVGTLAVKAIGLDSRQVVQEIRDLVAGGIQAASSTLATSLGLRDKDIAEAKKNVGTFSDFLLGKLNGFAIAASEKQNTLSGAWEGLILKVQRLFADDKGFTAFKRLIKDISNSIGTIDVEGNLKLNPAIVDNMQKYWDVISGIGSALANISKVLFSILPIITSITTAFAAWLVVDKIFPKIVNLGSSLSNIFTASTIGLDKIKNFASLHKGGIIGLALFATWELADFTGFLDFIFGTAEKKLDSFRTNLSSYNEEQLKDQLLKLELERKSLIAKKRESLNPFAFQRDLAENLDFQAAIRKQIEDLNKSKAKGTDVESVAAFANAEKEVLEIFKKQADAKQKLIEHEEELKRYDTLRDTRIKQQKFNLIGASPEDTIAINKQISKIESDRLRMIANENKRYSQELAKSDKVRFDTFAEGSKHTNQMIDEEAKSIDKENAKRARANELLVRANDLSREYIESLRDQREERELNLHLIGKSKLEVELLKQRNIYEKKSFDIREKYRKAKDEAVGTDKTIAFMDEQKALESLNDEYAKHIASIKETDRISRHWTTGAIQAINEYTEAARNSADQTHQFFSSTFKALENDVVNFAKTGIGNFASFRDSVIDGLIRIQVQKAIAGVGDMILPFFASPASKGSIPTSGPGFDSTNSLSTFAANGKVFSNSGLMAFAKGGAFSNSIVSTPTVFPFAKGTGLMGEAGPEAIMPLGRTTSGDLGVKVSGNGGGTVINKIDVSVNIDSNGQATSNVSAGNANQLGDVIGQAVQQELIKQMRPGGLLASK